MFVNGDLKGKFIMDRNLGARDTKRSLDGAGIVMFQFGRKDPIPGGVSGLATVAYLKRETETRNITKSKGSIPVYQSVLNPLPVYLESAGDANWCSGVNSATYLWNDFEEDYRDNGKSLFDPSPKGWKVPASGTWGLESEKTAFSTSTMTDWDYTTETMGRSYPRDNPFVYYPVHGYRYAGTNSATLESFTTSMQIWTSSPNSTVNSNNFVYSNVGVLPTSGGGRANMRQTRPVQHEE